MISALLLLLSLQENSLPARYGLSEPTEGRDVVYQAIEKANLILGPQFANRMRAGWLPPLPNSVPVFLVEGSRQPAACLAYVPDSRRVIFVSSDELSAVQDRFGGPKSGGLSVRSVDLLALVLLHESGHIHYKDYLKPTSNTQFDEREIDESPDAVSNVELRADLFAVSRIKTAFHSKAPNAFSQSMDLGLALSSLSFNLMGARILDHFAANALKSPELFRDSSYTHANLELRFLIMNYRLAPSKASRSNLDAFLAWRRKAIQAK